MRPARVAMLFRFLLPPERKGESGKTKRPPGFGKPTARWGEERAFASSLAGRGRRCGPDATRRGKGLRPNRTEVTMNTNPTLQDRAVEAAARFLEVRGYETLATGWKSPETRGTIDLVARDPESDDLVFVDVSARPSMPSSDTSMGFLSSPQGALKAFRAPIAPIKSFRSCSSRSRMGSKREKRACPAKSLHVIR